MLPGVGVGVGGGLAGTGFAAGGGPSWLSGQPVPRAEPSPSHQAPFPLSARGALALWEYLSRSRELYDSHVTKVMSHRENIFNCQEEQNLFSK